MTEIHFIRVHRPFSVPKQWVVIADDGAILFTEDQTDCTKMSLEEAVALMDQLRGTGLVIALDAM